MEAVKLRLMIADDDLTAPAADLALGDVDAEWQDDVLRLIFTCAHPALPMEGRVALTLRTVAGLTTAEIARAVPGERGDDVAAAPAGEAQDRRRRASRTGCRRPRSSTDRTAGVLAVVYLLFTEGYAPDDGRVVRDELAEEAIRLARLVAGLTQHPEARGLLALLLLQHARRAARLDAAGDLVPLDEQDRSSWDAVAIAEGLRLVAEAPLPRGPYAVQAAIAAEHDRAPSAADTDWAAIVGSLRRAAAESGRSRSIAPSPSRWRTGRMPGSRRSTRSASRPRSPRSHLLAATRGDLLRRAGRRREAIPYLEDARHRAPGDAERRFFDRRLAECRAADSA